MWWLTNGRMMLEFIHIFCGALMISYVALLEHLLLYFLLNAQKIS